MCCVYFYVLILYVTFLGIFIGTFFKNRGENLSGPTIASRPGRFEARPTTETASQSQF